MYGKTTLQRLYERPVCWAKPKHTHTSLLVVLFKLQTAMHGTVPSFSQLVVSVRVESGKASVRNWGTQVVDDRQKVSEKYFFSVHCTVVECTRWATERSLKRSRMRNTSGPGPADASPSPLVCTSRVRLFRHQGHLQQEHLALQCSSKIDSVLGTKW